MEQQEQREEFHITGDELVKKVREIIREGNARMIIVKNEEGKEIIHLPLTLGAVGAIISPPLVAVGAIAALLTKCTVVVVKK